jgi:hypothetical protein
VAARNRTKEDMALTLAQVAAAGGNISLAAEQQGIPRPTMQARYREASTLLPNNLPDDPLHIISDLKAKLKVASASQLSEDRVRDALCGLKQAPLDVPKWSLAPPSKGRTIGIPMTIWSDWHFGEVRPCDCS